MRGPVKPASVAIGVLGALVFAQVVRFDFAYDDRWTLVENRWLDRPLAGLVALLATGRAVALDVPDATRPVMVLGHWLERHVYGTAAWGYHLDSLLLYGLVCALAAVVAFCLTRRFELGLVAGAFFAVAPIHAEAVAAVNYREDLYAAFGMLGAWALIAPEASASGPDRGERYSTGRLVGASALLAFALLGKESAIAIVPLLALCVWLLPSFRARVLADRRMLVVLGAVFLVWLVWRVPLAAGGKDLPLAPKRALFQNVLRTARFEVQAVRYALLPWSYNPDHWRQPDASFGWMGPFVSLLVLVFVFGNARATRMLALGLGIALAAPLGCCPLLRPVNEYGDRYFFLSILGGGIVWGWLLLRAAERFDLPLPRPWLAISVIPLVVPAWRATAIWRNERTLWTAAVELTPQSPRAWLGLSRVHRALRDRDGAEQAIERAVLLNPDYAPARVTQIYTDLAFGRLEQARAHLAEMDAKGYRDEGGLGKARECAKLDASAAAHCIGP